MITPVQSEMTAISFKGKVFKILSGIGVFKVLETVLSVSNGLCWSTILGPISHLIRGGLILGHIRDVRPEWVSFPGRKPADGCKFFTKNLRMSHNFDKILPGNGCVSSKLNKTYRSSVNFYRK